LKHSALFILAVFITFPAILHSQDFSNQKDGIFFFKREAVFKPLKSGVFEARTGMFKDLNDDYLRLDIGTSGDIIGYKDSLNIYSAGVDFFTFSNLRSESNLKFPVDAIDYFFGINFNYKRKIKDNLYVSSRLRISHISSHLQDGHKYTRTDTIFTPVIYSREFVNGAVMMDYYVKKYNFRYMAGIEYLFKSIPDGFGALSGQFGAEFRYNVTDWLTWYISDEVRVVKADTISEAYGFNNNLETGVKFGFTNTTGLNVFFTYYDGQDYKGQYYYRMTNYKALGFTVDF
jgi:hypothetical protein